MLDFRNTNTLWCSILVETLVKLGLTKAVICPGSRSTPLTIAFAQHSLVEAIPILDERSASFFALGLAKKEEKPVALVCSSGTAGANFYPAVIEAKESGIPLIIFTADRPPELRYCHAGQTIDQLKLYGNHPNWSLELALPMANLDLLSYLRQNIIQGWSQSLYPMRGVVHFNCPFREPLAPIEEPQIQILKTQIGENFFAHLSTPTVRNQPLNQNYNPLPYLDLPDRGIIIGGLAQVNSAKSKFYCQKIAVLSQKLNYPVLAEALSPLRNYQTINPELITNYDRILRFPEFRNKLKPEVIIQIGELPTSKCLRQWLHEINIPRYVITTKPENCDPIHTKTIHLRNSLDALVDNTFERKKTNSSIDYWRLWQDLEQQTQNEITQYFQHQDKIIEAKIPWLISKQLPSGTPIFFANSMTVRYAEFFWQLNNSKIIPYFSRGANGIDGTLSTALGIAHSSDQPTVMITGDLALLHDTNGFLLKQHFQGHLTIILINNNGGGIFEILPISQYDPPFEEYFATPQSVNFELLAQTYGVTHHLITKWKEFVSKIQQLPTNGIRILELKTDRHKDGEWLKQRFWKPSKLK